MKALYGFVALSCIFAFTGSTQAADGKKLFDKHCKRCHSVEPGKHMIGPSLDGVVGKQAGTKDFKNYRALKGASHIWNEANLNAWIENPKAFIGKPTAMIVNVKDEDERKAIIEYMKAN